MGSGEQPRNAEGAAVKFFSLATLISFRAALIALLKATDALLLEGYGWTPRCRTADIDDIVYTKG